MKKDSFILHNSFYAPLKNLSTEDKASLFDAIFQYHIEGKECVLSPTANMAFAFMKEQFIKDHAKYEEKCQRNRENIAKRWNSKHTTEYKRIPSNTKHTDNDNDNDNDIKEKNTKKKVPGNFALSDRDFLKFWELYPKRNGKKLGKAKTANLFHKLKSEDKERILVAVKNYAISGQMAKDPERFIKSDYWREWLEPAETETTTAKESKPIQEFGGIYAD